jgi:thioredoxin reductase (NADPH)
MYSSGCIPKKLFHMGALLRESIHADTAGYGINLGEANSGDVIQDPKTNVAWTAIRENIQNHIRGLNFKYRVGLREKDVTYFNKLAKFIDPHTIAATDKKGQTTTITASRFLIATGGRPSPLECKGGELAISSDDVFSLEKSPGKTLCVGASYISLECAGFLAAIGLDVTVAVRSILLRGFDRECSERIDSYMGNHGIKFKREVTVSKLEKEENGRIKATLSDGSVDTYDTVLVAIGRLADTEKLGLENVGVKTNSKNRKVIGKFEQSSTPNIYAVGDVLDVSTTICWLPLTWIDACNAFS